MLLARPTHIDSSAYYATYLKAAQGEDAFAEFQSSLSDSLRLIEDLSEVDLDYAYAEAKWTIREVLLHILDAERVFAYRALRILRGDKTELPGFDEDSYVANSYATSWSKEDLIEAFELSRKSVILLFKNCNSRNLDEELKASGKMFSARLLAWLIVGHNRHHLQVIQERYLK
ncbi:MAG: DinB family protein [Bacteroidetes bacterium]|nr:DinB family protein [Bacteroidota bacterium]